MLYHSKGWPCSTVDTTKCDRHCDKCKSFRTIPKPIILACGQGLDVKLPTHEKNHDSHHEKDTLVAFVEIDTACLYKPVIKVDFSTNITFESDDNDKSKVKLLFKLIKCCNNNCELPIGEWIYSREFKLDTDKHDKSDCDELELETIDSFCFNFCKCESCSDCCVYKVIVEVENAKDVDKIKLKNTYINAMAQSL